MTAEHPTEIETIIRKLKEDDPRLTSLKLHNDGLLKETEESQQALFDALKESTHLTKIEFLAVCDDAAGHACVEKVKALLKINVALTKIVHSGVFGESILLSNPEIRRLLIENRRLVTEMDEVQQRLDKIKNDPYLGDHEKRRDVRIAVLEAFHAAKKQWSHRPAHYAASLWQLAKNVTNDAMVSRFYHLIPPDTVYYSKARACLSKDNLEKAEKMSELFARPDPDNDAPSLSDCLTHYLMAFYYHHQAVLAGGDSHAFREGDWREGMRQIFLRQQSSRLENNVEDDFFTKFFNQLQSELSQHAQDNHVAQVAVLVSVLTIMLGKVTLKESEEENDLKAVLSEFEEIKKTKENEACLKASLNQILKLATEHIKPTLNESTAAVRLTVSDKNSRLVQKTVSSLLGKEVSVGNGEINISGPEVEFLLKSAAKMTTQQSLVRLPAFYWKRWNKAVSLKSERAPSFFGGNVNVDRNTTFLTSAKRLLQDYAGGTGLASGVARFFKHGVRHHHREVRLIINDITSGSISTPLALLERLKEVQLVNPKGALARRIQLIAMKAYACSNDSDKGRIIDIFTRPPQPKSTLHHDVL